VFPMCLIIKEKHKSQWPLRYHDQKLSVIEISIDLTFLFSFQKKIKKKKCKYGMRKIYFYQLVHKYELFMCDNDRKK
jgi:hypothetical protein